MVDRIAGQVVPPWPKPGPSPVTGSRTEAPVAPEEDAEARRLLQRLFNGPSAQAVAQPRATRPAPADELTSHLGRFLDVIA